jgi:3-hydroxyisobutyrate dehydrogenase-like beta-hydroxyacid dehydrogenase
MGGAMAERVIAAGYQTVLWARRPEALTTFRDGGAEFADTPAQMAAQVDIVCICVWADDDVREVLLGDDGVLAGCRPGAIVAIHSTVLPATCQELAEVAVRHKAVLVDAPVSGGRNGALAGTLVVAAGGDEFSLERCLPVFSTFANLVVHVGPVGAGQYAKLINNTLLAANMAVADDALTLGLSLGIPTDAMVQVLRQSSGRSYALDVVASSRASADIRRQALPALEKDVQNLTSDGSVSERLHERAILADAASETLRRLAKPPRSWTD